MLSTNHWRTLAAAVALGFAFPGVRAMAQGGTGTVGGKVTDEQGAAVAGAQVNIEQIGKGAVTGSNGVYSIEAVPAGSHVVRVRIIGYRSQTKTVSVASGREASADFTLVVDPLKLEAVVVTGTETPRTKLETSNATTVLSAADLVQAAPRSTSEALRYVPGFTRVESSGGEVNENYTMRGILGVEYVMFMEDGLPVFPTMHTFFMNADNLFRIDENIDRMEIVRGAGSALFGSNTPGAIVNLINKSGGPEVQGSVKAYGGTGQLARTDFNVNGPLTPDWRFNIGGFYRYNRGVRDPGFPGTQGGQFKASLTRNFSNGYFRTSVKVIDDRNQFILDLPFNGGNSPQYVPGFSNYGSMNTNEANNISVPTPDGQMNLPLDNGLLTRAYWLTATAGFNLDQGWSIENSAQLMQDHQEWNALVPGDVMPADTAVRRYLTQYWGSYYQGVLQGNGTIPGNAQNISIGLQPGYTYGLTYPNVTDINGTPSLFSNANGLLAPGQDIHVVKPLRAFQDQLTFRKALEGGHNLSLGLYFANYQQTNEWRFTDVITDVQDNPHFVDMHINNANVVYHYTVATVPESTVVNLNNFAATQNGFRRFVSGPFVNAEGQTTVFSAVLGGSFKLSERLRADLGIRYENDNYVQTSQNSQTVAVNGDSLNSIHLVNQDVWGTPSSYRHFAKSIGDWAASIGLNYALTDQTSLYALGSRAYKMPALDEFIFPSASQQVALFGDRRNWTGEVGVKHASRNFGVTLDGFYTVLKDIVSQGFVTNPGTGQSEWIVQANPSVSSYGLELEGSGHLPNSGFGAQTNWTLLKAVYASCPTGAPGTVQTCPTGADVGTLLSGVPPIVGNLAITYGSRSGVSFDGDWHFVDRRCTSTLGCTTKLPTYSYLNLGAQYIIPSNGITIRADVLNVYQSIGLEEGNPRLSLVGGSTGADFLARPILPRALMVSMGYKF
ncbi:MAG TPA: TonB-dependent receptor [Gemmatimonadales bacterium]|nr:TonB-dependent receptor [Gemmatimonadales bacterium]